MIDFSFPSSSTSHKAFERLSTVAEGEGRCVYRVRHKHTDIVLAQKLIKYDGSALSYKTLQTELQLLHECHSPEIINFYGSFISGNNVNIVMEWMVRGMEREEEGK